MIGELRSMRETYGRTLVELGRENKDIVALDADLAKSTKTILFKKEFPGRFFDMGIAEQCLMDTAAGLAASGKIPFASTFAIFATGRAFEQIRNTIAYSNLNVKIVATHGGLTVGKDGSSHQPLEDIALMRSLPNMRVWVPADSVETEHMVRECVKVRGPVYIRLVRPKVPDIYDESYEFNERAIVMREGSDVSVIATGLMVKTAIEASEILERRGIDAEVINMHCIKPLDEKIVVKSTKKTGCAVTIEEHSVYGGLGSAVAEVLVENNPVPMRRIGTTKFGESGEPEALLKKFGLTAENLVRKAEEVIKRK